MDVEIAIVGGGVAGLATAWRAAAAGHDVLLLERFDAGHANGSSHGATRIFRTAYPDPLYVRLAQRALPMWRELEEATGTELLEITGGFDVGPPDAIEPIAAAQEACGERVERLGHGELTRRAPWLILHADAVWSPTYGVLAADRVRAALASAARAAGARIREGVTATIAEVEDDAVVLAVPERVRARRCVVAAGAWAGPMLEPLGIALPVRVTREQVLYFEGEDVVPFLHHPAPFRYAVPAAFGSAGVKVAEHFGGTETTADGRTFERDEEAAARVRAYVDERLPGLDDDPVAYETCLYTTTPDERFLLEARGPLVVASACSGHGFKFAPAIGEIALALATGADPGAPMDRFRI